MSWEEKYRINNVAASFMLYPSENEQKSEQQFNNIYWYPVVNVVGLFQEKFNFTSGVQCMN